MHHYTWDRLSVHTLQCPTLVVQQKDGKEVAVCVAMRGAVRGAAWRERQMGKARVCWVLL